MCICTRTCMNFILKGCFVCQWSRVNLCHPLGTHYCYFEVDLYIIIIIIIILSLSLSLVYRQVYFVASVGLFIVLLILLIILFAVCLAARSVRRYVLCVCVYMCACVFHSTKLLYNAMLCVCVIQQCLYIQYMQSLVVREFKIPIVLVSRVLIQYRFNFYQYYIHVYIYIYLYYTYY